MVRDQIEAYLEKHPQATVGELMRTCGSSDSYTKKIRQQFLKSRMQEVGKKPVQKVGRVAPTPDVLPTPKIEEAPKPFQSHNNTPEVTSPLPSVLDLGTAGVLKSLIKKNGAVTILRWVELLG